MYSKNRIGVILPVQEDIGSILGIIQSIPPYIDRVYLVGNGVLTKASDSHKALKGDPRVTLVVSQEQNGGDLNLTPAYLKAVEDQMDIVSIINGSSVPDTKYLPSLLDPIVWGRADITKMINTVPLDRRDPPVLTNRSLPPIPAVSETKISLNYRELSEVLRNDIALSRDVLELIKITPGHELNKKILLAIPCLEETLSIGSVILQAQHYVNEIIVVDDGCLDDTLVIAKSAGAKVLSPAKNSGQETALKSCFEYARKNDFDILITMRGDGRHDPRHIPNILSKLLEEEVDIIIGSRFCADISDVPFYKRFGKSLMDRLTGFASTTEIGDSQSDYRAFGRRAIERMLAEVSPTTIDSEIYGGIQAGDLTVHLIPLRERRGVVGKLSEGTLTHGLKVFRALINLIGYEHPMLTFGLSGAVATSISLTFGFIAFSEYYSTNKLPYGPFIISGILLILGLLLITAGFILDTMVQILKRQTGRRVHEKPNKQPSI